MILLFYVIVLSRRFYVFKDFTKGIKFMLDEIRNAVLQIVAKIQRN